MKILPIHPKDSCPTTPLLFLDFVPNMRLFKFQQIVPKRPFSTKLSIPPSKFGHNHFTLG